MTNLIWVVELARSSKFREAVRVIAIVINDAVEALPAILYVTIIPPYIAVLRYHVIGRLQGKG